MEVYDLSGRYVGELSGGIVNGSFQYSGDSSVRRTLSLSAYIDEESFENMLTINRCFKAFLIHDNGYEKREWPLGVYVPTSTNKPSGGVVSITAMDKMAFLNGTVSGVIEGVLYADKTITIDSDGVETETKMRLDEIIYYVVAGLGGERRENIIIGTLPQKIKSPMIYEGSSPIYVDASGTIYEKPGDNLREVKYGDYLGYTMQDFIFPSDLIKQPGEVLTSILDDIKNLLGNYEYFYDVEGRFVFQEIQNYVNNQFQNYTRLENSDYIADLRANPYVYKFTPTDENLVGITGTPQWQTIKNNFLVWGLANGQGRPVCYHLVVDNKPKMPAGTTIPYQQYLINAGNMNPTDPGPYYGELKSKFPQIYDAEKNEWLTDDVNDWTYFFDMVDADADYSKFSVSEIGKRTMAVSDPQVGSLFDPVVPDYVLVNMDDADFEEQTNYLDLIGQKYVQVPSKIFKLIKRAGYSKSALSVVRELLYNNTSAIEQITITCKPMMQLEPNTIIEIDNPEARVNGEFLIKTISYQFGMTMNVNAMEIRRRT